MNAFDVDGDYYYPKNFYYDGDVMITGTFKVDGSVSITGTLQVVHVPYAQCIVRGAAHQILISKHRHRPHAARMPFNRIEACSTLYIPDVHRPV